jgi:hypothetical protein
LTLEVLEAVQSGRKFAFIGSNFSFRLGRWLEFEESIQLSKILKEKGVDLSMFHPAERFLTNKFR